MSRKSKTAQRLRLLQRWLPGCTVELLDQPSSVATLSYGDLTRYIPLEIAYEIQSELLKIRDRHLPFNLAEYLRVNFPTTLEECEDLRNKRRAKNGWMEQERRKALESRAVNEVVVADTYTNLVARWEFIGLDQWLEESYGPGGKDEQVRSAPRIRFLLQWGDDKSVSFVMGFWPHTVTLWDHDPDDFDEDELSEPEYCPRVSLGTYENYELELRDIQGDVTDCEWQEDFDVDLLYFTAREMYESGERSGELYPVWGNHPVTEWTSSPHA
jgi:hypothetical protein